MAKPNQTGILPVGGTENPLRKLDIVFVHRLGGDAYSTWWADEESQISWPQWLAEDFADVGVWTIGYGATASRWVEDVMPMEDRSVNLINRLSVKGIGERQLIFVTHSMGGLITKYILTHAEQSNNPKEKQIATNCAGVVFIAVPHDGSGLANILDNARVFVRRNKIVKQLQKDESSLRALSNRFVQYTKRQSLACLSFYETKEVRIRKRTWKTLGLRVRFGLKVVSESSASGRFSQPTPVPLDDDHISICKLSSREDQLYENMLLFVNERLPSSTPEVPIESSIENKKIQVAKFPKTSSTKLFGREDELTKLDEAWTDNKTNVMVLVAMGGTGKTALLKHWLDNLAVDNFRGAQAVYTWSFYSQGAAEDRQASADEFFDQTLEWFRYEGKPITSVHEKGLKLAGLVCEQRSLLVLDGLEPLQYPPGELAGHLKDQGLQALLQQLAAQNPGLCVVTTRLEVADLSNKSQVTSHDLEQLAVADGVHLLDSMSVHGSDKDMQNAVKEFGGHALALNLLGNFIGTVHNGDIRKRDLIPALTDDPDQAGHAKRVMASYEKQLAGTTELSILYLLGLFDRPASKDAIQSLRDAKVPQLTEGLQVENQWQFALKHLRQLHLVNPANPEQPNALDAHPLVREYFGKQLQDQKPKSWQRAHEQLYEFYKAVPEKEQPDTLNEMEPLFAAIAHGCAAGLHQQAWDEVHSPRILRGKNHYVAKKLGAFGSNLSTLSQFFDQVWHTPAAELRTNTKARVLNWAAFSLRALGRLREAVEPMQAGMQMDIEREDRENAAIAAGNLSELHLTRGDVESAVSTAHLSVELADKSEDSFQRMNQRGKLADALHQAGETSEAQSLFQQAETLQHEQQPDYPRLYSLPGFRYCDLMLSRGEWREVQERATQTLEWVKAQGILLATATDQLSLGRASDQGAQQQSNAALKTKLIQETQNWLNQAVAGLREAGQEDYLPRGLLARAAFYRRQQQWDAAKADLQDAFDIAQRGEMRLHLTDYHLESARLALAEANNESAAREHIDAAAKLIAETGYKRRLPELEEFRRVHSMHQPTEN